MEFSPNLISSSCLEDQALVKVLKQKISSEIIDFYISQQVTSSEKKDKKVEKTHKWLKTSSKKESYSHLLLLSNYLKNVSLFMEIEDIFSMVSLEILKIGKNSKNNFLIMLSLEIWFISIVQLKFWLKESCKEQNKAEDLMITQKRLKKDLKPLKIKQYQLSKISKAEVTV